MDWLSEQAGFVWLIVAALFAICELLIPGVYLTFLALGAAATGVLALIFPELGAIGQFISFAAWSTVAVLIGKRWYGANPVPSSDPDLNNRAARMIGQSVTVVDAISGGTGRVRVGDGEWPAEGPDLAPGEKARIVAVRGGVVVVDAIRTIAETPSA
ncbi:NfeD family protein [Sphingomonas suaedae]|uniref:NfeD family protein n=1 Tax=Sphingomonas suaedae TaxID=2599297 RepID=A0A518RDD3_9SPHN|nr:NfeD family protein [Sphingomonas suaedae]QDX25391.1 NfeD family protein [Sphingomonas suaedae]